MLYWTNHKGHSEVRNMITHILQHIVAPAGPTFLIPSSPEFASTLCFKHRGFPYILHCDHSCCLKIAQMWLYTNFVHGSFYWHYSGIPLKGLYTTSHWWPAILLSSFFAGPWMHCLSLYCNPESLPFPIMCSDFPYIGSKTTCQTLDLSTQALWKETACIWDLSQPEPS